MSTRTFTADYKRGIRKKKRLNRVPRRVTPIPCRVLPVCKRGSVVGKARGITGALTLPYSEVPLRGENAMSKPSEKSPDLERFLEEISGRTTAIKNNVCLDPPIGCGGPAHEFRD